MDTARARVAPRRATAWDRSVLPRKPCVRSRALGFPGKSISVGNAAAPGGAAAAASLAGRDITGASRHWRRAAPAPPRARGLAPLRRCLRLAS